jgi:hypothetical protein
LSQKHPQRQKNVSEACGYQVHAWQTLTEALEIARKADWRNAICNGLNLLAKVYREIDSLQNLPSQFIEDSKIPDTFEELQSKAMSFQIPFEAEYEHELLTDKPFDQLNLLERAARLFELSALIADEVNDFRLTLESLTELSKTLIALEIEDRVPVVIRRIERMKGYDYHGELFAAMSEITLGDLEFKQQRFDAALQRYKKAYADMADQSGYARDLLTDRLRDLEWHLRDLAPEIALQWCDVLEREWLDRSLSTKRPDMLDLLEHIRFEVLMQQTLA